MPIVKYPYSKQPSKIFNTILRPLVTIKIYSLTKKIWVPIYEVLADTGADITVLPRYLGEFIVDDITKGKYIEIKGIVPTAVVIAFVHNLKLKIAGKEFKTKVAIADTNNVRPILGRFNTMDLFSVIFQKGECVIFKNKK